MPPPTLHPGPDLGATLWKETKGKPLGKKGPLCAWDLARPQGFLTPFPQRLPSVGLLRLRLITQKWTRSTSWLANGCWQAVQAMGRERCFSPRHGRHRRWPQGSWYTGSFLK